MLVHCNRLLVHSIAVYAGSLHCAGYSLLPYIVQVTPTSENIWRIDGASGQVSGVRLITTYNKVDYYLAASEDHGFLMYTQEEIQFVPHYELKFDIVAV